MESSVEITKVRAGRVKPKTLKLVAIAPSPRPQHSKVRIKGLSDMTLKTKVTYRKRCGLTAKAISAKHMSKFAAFYR
jgi:hypothetical protein